MRRLLKPFAKEITALSDLELAHAGAFAGGPGVLLIAGTGSSAYSVDSRGKIRRAGGWGPLLGDDGSAFWLGRQALRDPKLRSRLRLNPLDFRGPDAVRKVAALAPRVLQASPSLRRTSASLLTALVREADPSRKLPVSWTGGLMSNPALKRELERRVRLRPPVMAPECAAYLWPSARRSGRMKP
jgi:N-acetylglucosamine kinase-like BadF-type ATPase